MFNDYHPLISPNDSLTESFLEKNTSIETGFQVTEWNVGSDSLTESSLEQNTSIRTGFRVTEWNVESDSLTESSLEQKTVIQWAPQRGLNPSNWIFDWIRQELGANDLRRDLHLVVQVIRVGRILYAESSKKPVNQTYRRPHAVAVLALSELLSSGAVNSSSGAGNENGVDGSEEREFPLKLYQSEEKDYALWHEFIAKKINSKFSLLSGQMSDGMTITPIEFMTFLYRF